MSFSKENLSLRPEQTQLGRKQRGAFLDLNEKVVSLETRTKKICPSAEGEFYSGRYPTGGVKKPESPAPQPKVLQKKQMYLDRETGGPSKSGRYKLGGGTEKGYKESGGRRGY